MFRLISAQSLLVESTPATRSGRAHQFSTRYRSLILASLHLLLINCSRARSRSFPRINSKNSHTLQTEERETMSVDVDPGRRAPAPAAPATTAARDAYFLWELRKYVLLRPRLRQASPTRRGCARREASGTTTTAGASPATPCSRSPTPAATRFSSTSTPPPSSPPSSPSTSSSCTR